MLIWRETKIIPPRKSYIYNDKKIPDFENITDIKNMPANENMPMWYNKRPEWPTFDTEEEFLLED